MKIQLLDNSGKLIDTDIKITSKNILVFKFDHIIPPAYIGKIKEDINNMVDKKVLILDKNCSLQVLTIEDDEESFLGNPKKEFKGADNGTLGEED